MRTSLLLTDSETRRPSILFVHRPFLRQAHHLNDFLIPRLEQFWTIKVPRLLRLEKYVCVDPP